MVFSATSGIGFGDLGVTRLFVLWFGMPDRPESVGHAARLVPGMDGGVEEEEDGEDGLHEDEAKGTETARSCLRERKETSISG